MHWRRGFRINLSTSHRTAWWANEGNTASVREQRTSSSTCDQTAVAQRAYDRVTEEPNNLHNKGTQGRQTNFRQDSEKSPVFRVAISPARNPSRITCGWTLLIDVQDTAWDYLRVRAPIADPRQGGTHAIQQQEEYIETSQTWSMGDTMTACRGLNIDSYIHVTYKETWTI